MRPRALRGALAADAPARVLVQALAPAVVVAPARVADSVASAVVLPPVHVRAW